MKNYTLLLYAAMMIAITPAAEARPRTEAQMAEAAAKAINSHRTLMKKAPMKGGVRKLAEHNGLTIMGYEHGGFAIVTPDDLLPAVVAYSDKVYDEAQQADGFRWWFDAMQQAAAYYTSNGLQARIVAPDPQKHLPYVRPLLSTEWGQEEPFNNACPLLPDEEQYLRHCVVGCVGTATAQILNYHQWPTTGQGTTTLLVPYGDPTGTRYTFDFSECQFDWQHMRNTYTPGNYTDEEAQAVAHLSHAMGMMASMQYGLGFSGAISDDAANGLRDYFGISTAELYTRNDIFGMTENYSERDWSNLLFDQLGSVGPVYYAGADADDQGGHAFVIDGYDEAGLVHVNWGWHGRFDGYYDVSILNPRIYHFSKGQEMILGICPPQKVKGMTEVFTVDEPGTLAKMVELTQQMLGDAVIITGMNISGQLNADDLHFLAEMKQVTDLDLSKADVESDLLPPLCFYGCSNLRTLRLPESMRYYGDGALTGCSNLNILTIPQGDDKDYRIVDGVVYTPDMQEVIAVLPTTENSVTIADGVTTIHDYAFEGCKYVRIVSLPASVGRLGHRAFANVLIMRELHIAAIAPAEVSNGTFDGVDPGFLMLYIPAGSRPDYERAEGWSALFKSDNVTEVGTVIRARDITRSYGEDVDEYYFEVVGQRVKGLPRLWCEATPTSPAGQYAIHCEQGSVEGDSVTFENGILTIVGGPAGLNGDDEAAGTLTLGYCNGEVADKSQYGAMGNGYTSAAIYVPAEMLSQTAGADIVKIRAGMATRLNIDELQVWVRHTLDGDNLAEGKITRKDIRVQQGWNEVKLNTPYTINATDEGLYIGYTYHHNGLANAVSIVGTTPEGTAFFKQSDETQWQDISGQGALSIEAVVSGSSLTQYDLALDKATLSPDLSSGPTGCLLTVEVTNRGTRDITGFDLTFEAQDITPITTHLAQTVQSGRRQKVSVTLVPNVVVSGAATVTISRLDDGADENADNNTATATMSFGRHVLLEEFTTENCTNCPQGAETMHAALHRMGDHADDISVVCHHAAVGTDWLTQPCDEDYTWFFNEDGQTYAPSWMIDRKPYFDSNIVQGNQQAIYFPSSDEEFATMLEGAIQEQPHVMLGANATLADGQVTVKINGMRDDEFNLSDARLTVYLTEDNITAQKQAGVSGTYIHQHVIRAYNSAWGEPLTWSGNLFNAQTTFKLDPSWKQQDLKVVAFVANYDASSNLNCMVENSTETRIDTSTPEAIAVPSVALSSQQQTYDLQGRPINIQRSTSNTHRSVFIVRRADGSVIKVVK